MCTYVAKQIEVSHEDIELLVGDLGKCAVGGCQQSKLGFLVSCSVGETSCLHEGQMCYDLGRSTHSLSDVPLLSGTEVHHSRVDSSLEKLQSETV